MTTFCKGLLLVSAAAGLAGCSAAPPQPPSFSPPPRITVVAVGDILLGRKLGKVMAESGDFTLPFHELGEELTAADITFGNLEGPFCEAPPYPDEGMVFRVRPEAVEGLQFAGFDVLSLANNHALDGGFACLRFTLRHLRVAGILPVGAGENFSEAHFPAIIERAGVRFAFLAYTYAEYNDVPGTTRPAVAGRAPEAVRADVAAARQQADVVFVSLHDGAEYTRRVAPETEEFARAAIEAGATAVFGHHPHVPQRVERHGEGWIFYSLGNFVFQQQTPGTRTGLMARLTFAGARLEQVEAVPIWIEPLSQPRLATREEATTILDAIGLNNPVLWVRAETSLVPVGAQQ